MGQKPAAEGQRLLPRPRAEKNPVSPERNHPKPGAVAPQFGIAGLDLQNIHIPFLEKVDTKLDQVVLVHL